MTRFKHLPKKQGLYDPAFEHDACGVGFVCNIKGERSHEVIEQGIEVLERLKHRGAVGADPFTGDGAGLLIQMPHEFLKSECEKININLPEEGKYGVGLIFLPTNAKDQKYCVNLLEKLIKSEGQELLGWRDVLADDSSIGVTARETEPVIRHLFISPGKNTADQLAFERKLYVIRKQAENIVRASDLKQKSFFYVTNLSSRTLAYKGLLMPEQLKPYFSDLSSAKMKSAFALVHSRYSTNTFPTWDLAQPFRFLAHNGEINTLRGNVNWMHAREGLLKSKLFGKDLKKIFPVIVPDMSDSATLDMALELLVLGGRSIAHAMMMLIPEAWQNNNQIDKDRVNFYKYHACMMEPWDGPAAVAFTDGRYIGATLDRNGLRPARYVVTKDDFIVMASEVGVLDIAPKKIRTNGRLEPGKMFLIDLEEGRIVEDAELKAGLSKKNPYKKWLDKNIVRLADLPKVKKDLKTNFKTILERQKAFGYTKEDLKTLIKPMCENGKEPTGSMGNDTPHAVLSEKPQLLYNYFKQLFAQVTNPAIDPIREELVMTLDIYLGEQKNLFEEVEGHCRRLYVKNPILTNQDLAKISKIKASGFKAKKVSTLFEATGGEKAFKKRLDGITKEVRKAIKDGYGIIILSDRGVNGKYAALPALLAMGRLHHFLVDKVERTRVSIIVESGEPREVMHFALLFGYGADCINPYLAFETIEQMTGPSDLSLRRSNLRSEIASPLSGLAMTGILNLSLKKAKDNYTKAINKGLLKIFSKMGISTLQSYRGAQIFEAIGLNEKLVKKCFAGTTSRIGGVGLNEVAKETLARHKEGFPERRVDFGQLNVGGSYQWRKDGEFHLWNPDSIAALQHATQAGDYEKYKEFAELINDQSKNLCTLRGCLKFKKSKPIPIDEVEPAEEIFKRFATGAMSFGSISREAHEMLAVIMNKLGGRSNTGEGGEDQMRFTPLPDGRSKRSAVKQVASGRFGVSSNYLANADELQIKIAQGAKPGEGGQLPGHKVNVEIAKIRYSTPGVTLISPPPHHDIYSIEDLAQLIFDLKNSNPKARISVKLVSEVGVGTVAAGVAKGHSDMILISGGDGGTGASPQSSIKHAGLPWELGLSETHQTLVLNDLRSRVRLQTDGQMRTGRDVIMAAILGAEEYGFCTSALIVVGCVMLRHCHLNNCSVGVATQDPICRKRFRGKEEHLENYFRFVAKEIREIMAELGVRKIEDLIGRTELVEPNKDILNWKAKTVDFSRILYKPEVPAEIGVYYTKKQDHAIDNVLDTKLIEKCKAALDLKEPVRVEMPVRNDNRTVGTMLSYLVSAKHGEDGLEPDYIRCKFTGSAGQSFGAFLAKGVTLELEGDANDYVGKGLSGGKIIVYPNKIAHFVPEENIIIGNTTFYGATTGEAYIRGLAGERFCIRNSGLYGIVEGVGDHGCEYMTGGRVVILGKTGRNFGAGMSGGIAYVYDEDGKFASRCNMSMIELQKVGKDDELTMHELLSNHVKYTGSTKAKKVLDDFKKELKNFVKVMPLEYKRVLEGRIEKNPSLAEPSDG